MSRDSSSSSSPYPRGRRPCSSGTEIIYAWTKNAPKMELPEKTAFEIGGKESGIDYLVLQVL